MRIRKTMRMPQKEIASSPVRQAQGDPEQKSNGSQTPRNDRTVRSIYITVS